MTTMTKELLDSDYRCAGCEQVFPEPVAGMARIAKYALAKGEPEKAMVGVCWTCLTAARETGIDTETFGQMLTKQFGRPSLMSAAEFKQWAEDIDGTGTYQTVYAMHAALQMLGTQNVTERLAALGLTPENSGGAPATAVDEDSNLYSYILVSDGEGNIPEDGDEKFSIGVYDIRTDRAYWERYDAPMAFLEAVVAEAYLKLEGLRGVRS